MPQFNAPTAVTSILAADIILFWKTLSGTNQTITFANFVISVAALISHTDTVNVVSSNTTLNGSYQFVVANSAGVFNITLPLAISFPGQKFRIGNKGAGTVSVLASGSDGIAATTLGVSTTISQYKSYDFESDGIDTWFALAK